MHWRIAESLKKLREQINAEWPNRDKRSDGGIGDERHANNTSDHNPHLRDSKGQPVVSAIDIDEDLAPSINSIQFIVDAIIKSRDKRVKYIIYEGRICSSYPTSGYKAWEWRPYKGTKNPHKHHAHISVQPTQSLFDSRAEWSIGITPSEIKKLRDDLADAGLLNEPVPTPAVPAVPAAATASVINAPVSDVPHTADMTHKADVPSENTELRKERSSVFVKITAAVTAFFGFVSSVGINIGEFFSRATAEVTPRQILFTVCGLGLVAGGLWFYDRSAQRANRLNEQKIAQAGDPKQTTTELRG